MRPFSSSFKLLVPVLLLAVCLAGVEAAPTSAVERHETSVARVRRDVPEILLPDVLHDGRRKRGSNQSGCLKLSQAALIDLLHFLNRRRQISDADNAAAVIGKRFFDSLVRPVPINNGRRKRFLDSLVPSGSIYSGRRKRFLDSLVKPNRLFSKRAGEVDYFWDGEVWCPI